MSHFVKACVFQSASMRSFEQANSMSLSPLSFVMGLQLVPQIPYRGSIFSNFCIPVALNNEYVLLCYLVDGVL